MLLTLAFSGCLEKFDKTSKLPGIWTTKQKLVIFEHEDPQYMFFIFFEDGTFKTNFLARIVVNGTWFIKDDKLILHYYDKETVFDLTYGDKTYNTLKLRLNGKVTVFERQEN